MLPFKKFLLSEMIRQKLKNFQSVLDNNPDLKNAIELCKKIESLEPKAEALVVGGSVRDILLNKNPKDVDIATNVDIQKIANNFHTADIGKSKDFGIVTVQFNDGMYEVAHYREDEYEGETDSRHPSGVKLSTSFETDSARRDITINSLGLSTDGEIIDYQGGLEDLKNGIIKAVGSPKDRFIEDSLRMLRVGRFMARYGFTLDPATRQAIIDLKDTIINVSPERIREELFKSASNGKSLANYIEHLKEVGLLKLILPEIDVMSDFEQTKESHPEGNVFEHTMEALRQSKSNDALTNIALMFHDLGKPASQSFDPVTGRVKYLGHESSGLPIFDAISERLKFSNEQKDAIRFGIENHMIGHKMGELKKSKLLNLRQNKNWDVLKNVIYGDEASRKHLFNPEEHETKMKKTEELAAQFGKKEEFEKKMSSFVNGRMIMDVVPGIKGADIGKIKDQVRDWIVSNDFNIDPTQVNSYIQKIAKEIGYLK